MFENIVFDIEADDKTPRTVSVVHCIVVTCLDTGETRSIRVRNRESEGLKEVLAIIQNAVTVVGHNIIEYDLPVIKRFYDCIPTGNVHDTLIMSRLIYPDRPSLRERDIRLINAKRTELPVELAGSHSLAAWGYRLDERKGTFNNEETDWSKWSQEMQDYCEQDVHLNAKLYGFLMGREELSLEALDLEMAFATIIARQVNRGFAFDEQAAASLYADLCQKRSDMERALRTLFPPKIIEMKKPAYYKAGNEQFRTIKEALSNDYKRPEITPGPLKTKEIPFNPGSTDQISAALIEKYGWKPTEYTKTGKPQITEDILEGLPWPEAQELAEYKLLQKRIGQLAEGDSAWLKMCRMGRIHGRVNTMGCVTGRCSHSEPNLGQIPRVSKKRPDDVVYRQLFIPSISMILCGCDASGLELRCLAHYMAKFDDGDYVSVVTQGDVHSVNQKAAGLPTRDHAKTFIYGFLYGAGDEKIGSIVEKDRNEGKRLKNRFLKTLPALRRLKDGVEQFAETHGYIRGLDGRIIPIRSPHASLNTLLQSAGAIIMKRALVILDARLKLKYVPGVDYEFVVNVHDEWQLECTPDIVEDMGQESVMAIEDAGKYFSFRCPLAGEYKVGKSWAETH